jgi:uracil-DNA glycosylase
MSNIAGLPRKVNICVVGGYWGNEEEKERCAFVGTSGYHLTKMLNEAGINRADCLLTNVFNLRPKGNKLESLCGPKGQAIQGYPALLKGKYLHRSFEPELTRLGDELIEADPNLIIALGNEAMWALLGKSAISKFRGTTELSTHTVTNFKVLSTYNPAAVLRDWSIRPIVVSDLHKAAREAEYPEIRRPKCEIWIEPTLKDLEEFYEQYICGCKVLSVDIETVSNRITCIGFAPSPGLGIVIPFDDSRRKGRSYWPDHDSETKAWLFVRGILEDGRFAKLFQNGLYDIAFLWRAMGIRVINATEDSMLLHHALQPESKKGLGFLGSLYTDHGPWKHMRAKHETIKRDD